MIAFGVGSEVRRGYWPETRERSKYLRTQSECRAMESTSQDEFYGGALATLYTLDCDVGEQFEAYLERALRT